MSDRIALQAMSMGAVAIRDRQPRQDAERRFPRPVRHSQPPASAPGDAVQDAQRASANTPAIEDPSLPAATLFAAALLSQEQNLGPSLPERRDSADWQPPESGLRLADKLI